MEKTEINRKTLAFVLICALGILILKHSNTEQKVEEQNVIRQFPVIMCDSYHTTIVKQQVTMYLQEKARQELIESAQKEMNDITYLKVTDKQKYLHEYKAIVEKYIEVIDPPEYLSTVFTEEEIEAFAKLVEAEATGGSFSEKANVSSVIINRLESEDYPDTLLEVIYQKSGKVAQFSPTIDGRLNKAEPNQDTYDALEYTWLFGSTAYDCIGFDNCQNSWNGNNLELVFTDDIGHSFYRKEVLK